MSKEIKNLKINVHNIYGVEIEAGTINIDSLRKALVDAYNKMLETYGKEAVEAGELDEFSETKEPVRFHETEKEMVKVKALIGVFCSLEMPNTFIPNFNFIDDLFNEEDNG